MLYLSSDLPLLWDEELKVDHPRRRQFEAYRAMAEDLTPIDLTFVSDRTMSEIARLSDAAFQQHLADKMEFFAQFCSPEWETSYTLYRDQLISDIDDWVASELKGNNKPEFKSVLELLPEKLERLFFAGFMYGAPFLPTFAGGIPLLSPIFVHALVDLFLKLGPAFSLVSFNI